MKSERLKQSLNDVTLTTENVSPFWQSFCKTLDQHFKECAKILKTDIKETQLELKRYRFIKEKTEQFTKKISLESQPWKITLSDFNTIETLFMISKKKEAEKGDIRSFLHNIRNHEYEFDAWGHEATKILLSIIQNIEEISPNLMIKIYIQSITDLNLTQYKTIMKILKLHAKTRTSKIGLDVIRKRVEAESNIPEDSNIRNVADFFFANLALPYLIKQSETGEIGHDLLGKTFLQEMAKVYQKNLNDMIGELEAELKELNNDLQESSEQYRYIRMTLVEPLSKNLTAVLAEPHPIIKKQSFALWTAEWIFLLDHERAYFEEIDENFNSESIDNLKIFLKKVAFTLFHMPKKTIETYKKIAPKYNLYPEGITNTQLFNSLFNLNLTHYTKQLVMVKKPEEARKPFEQSFIDFYLKNTYLICLSDFFSLTSKITENGALEISSMQSDRFFKENTEKMLKYLTDHANFLYRFYINKRCTTDKSKENDTLSKESKIEKADDKNQVEKNKQADSVTKQAEQPITQLNKTDLVKNKNVVSSEILYAFMNTKTIPQRVEEDIYKTLHTQYKLQRTEDPNKDYHYRTLVNESEVDFWNRQLRNCFPNTAIILAKYPKIDLEDIYLIEKIVKNPCNFKKHDWDNIISLFERLGGNITQNSNGSEMIFSYTADNLFEYNAINHEYKKVSKISDVIDKPHGKQVNHKMLGKGKKWKTLLERLGFTEETLFTWQQYLTEMRSSETKNEYIAPSYPSFI